MKSTSTRAKKRVARSAKKPNRSLALMAKQHRKQSAAMKRKPVVDRTPPVATAPNPSASGRSRPRRRAEDGRRSMPFLFSLVFPLTMPLTMMSMLWGTREAR
jgi:hypothetical protein